ncbi:hypothetical protein FA95DRAFT_1570849 [Auriscalpium vulgare]|uniref:Uncharacterized protein n=1 Tax=Auriscalpium vulgare TaxID=40419 RepID=A0ACB8S1L6_9AGAM|nr:hypothetical protein FA95DRAFT_1570849 [Auriscalpium vulgare]
MPSFLKSNHFLFGHLVKSGADAALLAQCPPNPGQYALKYTGLALVDSFACYLATFFQTSLGPGNLPYFIHFLASWAVLIAFPFLEAARQGRPLILAFPVIHGILYQTASAGVMYPLYWAAFILTGRASTRLPREHAKISQGHAEATLFGFIIGFVVLSGSMLVLKNPKVTALWQLFPVAIQVLVYLYNRARPASDHPHSGYTTVQATWFIGFFISAISHIAVVYPKLGDGATLKHYFVPRVSVPYLRDHSLSLLAHVFLQWDETFTSGSSLLGSLWFAENLEEALRIAIWNLAITPVLGPGAATAGVLMWREWKLNGSGVEDADAGEGKKTG